MDRREEIAGIFSIRLRAVIMSLDIEYEGLQEIRMRAGAPMLCIYYNQEYYISPEGRLTKNRWEGMPADKKEIQETLEYIGNYSLYAYEEEVRQGFITIQGGHRVGVAGRAVTEGGNVRSLRHISFLNIRFAHEVRGCAGRLVPMLVRDGRLLHTLIISPPRCGKTTLLRDCIRLLSDGTEECPGQTVGVVDERSEIAGCYLGVPQNDVGIRTDVLDCCPKAEGILMLVRAMAPQIIAVDEIGSEAEARAIETALYTGCRLIATVHGSSLEDIRRKPVFRHLIEDRQVQRYVVLAGCGKAGVIQAVLDENGREVRQCLG